MKILILNQTFYPDATATAQLMWDLAQHLDGRGHRVTAVTSHQIYGTGRVHDRRRERIQGIEIHRLGGSAFGKKGLPARVSDSVSFHLAAGGYLLRAPAPDAILCLTSPPMIASVVAAAQLSRRLVRRSTVRVVYHVMDLYPDAFVASGVFARRGLMNRMCRGLTGGALRAADAVVAVGRDMRDRIVREYGVNPDRVHVVTPWGDSTLLAPVDRLRNSLAASLGLADTFNIVHSGNLGVAHDVDTILQAVSATRDDTGMRWVFIGDGRHFPRIRKMVVENGWRHVRLLPYQDRSTLSESLSLADVHLVGQLPAFTGVVVPSKLFGILAVARPTVMIGPPDAECSMVVMDHDAGFVVPNGNAALLVRRLRQLRADPALGRRMGDNGRAIFEREYDRPLNCGRIEAILRSVSGN